MTQNVSGWMPNLLGPHTIQLNGVTITPSRGTWNFIGATIADDTTNERTDFTFASTFASSLLKIANPGGTFYYTFVGAALAADRNVTLPLLVGNDTFVFEAHAQTLTNKTLTSPVIGGTPVISATSTTYTTNEEQLQTELQVNLRTASNTPALLLDYDTTADRMYLVRGFIVAQDAATNEYGYWDVDALFENDSNVLTLISASGVTEKENATTTPTLAIAANGDDIELTATGVAAVPMRWSGRLMIHEILSVPTI